MGGSRRGDRTCRATARWWGPPDRTVRGRDHRSPEHGGDRRAGGRCPGPHGAQERAGVTFNVSQYEISPDQAHVSRETPGWTPIAEEAERAARVLHPDRYRMPRPTHRRGMEGADP